MPATAEDAWPTLKPLIEQSQVPELLATVREQTDDALRVATYRLAIRRLAFDDLANKNLDVMTALADEAIADCERLGGDFIAEANLICFNTSANLCDCWEDGIHRERRHFEKGLEYARKAFDYRVKLEKGPKNFALAQWAIGKHLLSLGDRNEARQAFKECLEYERLASLEEGKPAEISPEATDGYLIATGYAALVDNNDTDLQKVYAVLDDWEARGGEHEGDAKVIRSQLQATARLMNN